MRMKGYENTSKAMLSRAVCVLRKSSIIINLPGSPKGVHESLSAILEILPHAYEMVKGKGHGKEKGKIKNEKCKMGNDLRPLSESSKIRNNFWK
jgi:hypothetical protein